MSGRPVAQEMLFVLGALVVFAVIVVIVAIVGTWMARKQGGSAIWLGLGYLVGGGLIAFVFAAGLGTPSYAYPENFFTSGYFVAIGALFIAGGSTLAFRKKRDPQKPWFSGGLWLAVNSGIAAGVGQLLFTLDLMFIPVMLLAVSAGQWLLIRRTYRVSALWLLGGVALSLDAFTQEGPTALFFLGYLLYAVIGGVLLNKHNQTAAIVFGLGIAVSWVIFAEPLGYIHDMFSYLGMVIIWSSSVVGAGLSFTINRSEKNEVRAATEIHS